MGWIVGGLNRVRAVAGAAVLVVALAAQERRPAFGTVTANGVPIAGARVVGAGSPWFGEIEGPTDEVEAVTDARGRFVLRLLPDRGYGVFAISTHVEGTACSAVAELVCGGDAPLSLGTVQLPGRLRVTGEEDWREFAPLRFEVASHAGQSRWVSLAADRQLPVLPGPLRVRVRGGDGTLVWDDLRWFGSDGLSVLELPPIQPLALRVRDVAGRPVAGAELWQEIARDSGFATGVSGWIRESERPSLRRAGTTAADGMVELRLPVAVAGGKVMSRPVVQVRAPGQCLVYAGVQQMGPPFVGAAGIRVPDDLVLPVTLEPDLALTVDPPTACSVFLVAEQMQGPQRCETHVRATTDDHGRGRVPLQLGRNVLGACARVDVRGEPPVWTVAACDARTVTVPRTARELDVQVTTVDAGPPRGVRCVAIPRSAASGLPDVPVPLDGAGRGSIRLGPGEWLLLATMGDHAAHRLVLPDDAGGAVALALAPQPTVTIRAVDAQKRPVPHAKLPRLSRFARAAVGWPDSALVSRQSGMWWDRQDRGADGEGRLVLPLLLHGTQQTLQLPSQPVPMHPGDVIDVVVE